MAISHIFQVDKQLFFLIASPVHGWMPTSMMYEDMAQTKKLSHYDSLFSNLNKYDQFRFLNALNCGRYLDHYYVLILYDSSKGIRDIREEYSSEDIEISVNDSSFSLPIYSVEYANSSFGSPMYSRRLVVYQPSSDSLREAFNYEYVRYGFLDNELRLFDYSFNDKNIKLRGFVWYAGDTSLQFGPGYPDTTRLKPLYRRFDYDGKIFKQE
jgi:hypothetical protein